MNIFFEMSLSYLLIAKMPEVKWKTEVKKETKLLFVKHL